ncbi:Hsp20/alpha crystallin family protein [Streptomyces ficellus]|uniref:Hsp20/alpha crystallin family protein n=1 Tax=Streptomyces ficellus TaxID=1977088 RepID=A0ABT7Z6U0_9ACTN|nr:Hsp20/alpha crystallin family protein [Streptomyces ficellus]MDN3295209.1 Hsp20/alpha crystallin family protein [Streptomyces ficellus]
MLMRTDAVRELDRIAQQMLGSAVRPAAMPMDAYRNEDEFVVHVDLPGIDPETIDLDIEQNVLTITAERRSPAPSGTPMIASERPTGTHTRQLLLADTLDTERIDASYDAGVLTLRLPLSEKAKPRKIRISSGGSPRRLTA